MDIEKNINLTHPCFKKIFQENSKSVIMVCHFLTQFLDRVELAPVYTVIIFKYSNNGSPSDCRTPIPGL